MIKVRSLSAVLALGALAALPGCSMFGGGEQPAPVAAAPAPAPAPTPAPPPPSSPQGNEASRSTVRQVQVILKKNRMYSGAVDGIWGPRTRRGLIAWQHKNDLQATGDLDDATLQAMNIAAPAGNSGGMSGGGMSNESGANGTNMPSGSMNDNSMSAPPPMSGPGTGGVAAPAR
ncbi:MAG: peptidoglycan-binding domain-containing protein [Acetobacteraceae bacterium]